MDWQRLRFERRGWRAGGLQAGEWRRLVLPASEKSIGLNLKREEAVRIEPGIDTLQFEKAADHKSRADEEYIRESDFETDNDFARETSGGEAFTAAGAAQNDHHVRTSHAPSGREAEDCCGDETRGHCEDQHGRINANGIEAREMCRCDSKQFVNSEPGDA